MNIRLYGALFFLSFLTINSHTFAASLDLNLRAEAGISKETRQWIDTLPEKIRKEMLQLIKDAQPIVDESILRYLDRVDQIISKQTANARCEIQGLAEQLLDSIRERLTNQNPRRIKELEEKWSKWSLGKNQSIHSVVTDYADFALDAQKTLCYAAPAHEAAYQAAIIRNKISRRWTAWSRAKEQCDTFVGCFDYYSLSVAKAIEESDPRDIEVSNAIEMSKLIEKPEHKWFSWTFNHKPYEEQQLIMFHILDSIEIAKQDRLTRTKKIDDQIKHARSREGAIDARRREIARQISKTESPRHKENMVKFMTEVKVSHQNHINQLNSIVSEEPSQEIKLTNLKSNASALMSTINKNLNDAKDAYKYDPPEPGHQGGADLK